MSATDVAEPVRIATHDRLAPAKINLALHVTGQRPDGYHTLSSLAVFADTGDRLAAEPASADSLDLAGPFAAALRNSLPAGAETSMGKALRVARAVARDRGFNIGPLALRLCKRLPVASGIGGGSADAAAVLRLVADACPPLREALREASISVGADVPMCFDSRAAHITGIGEKVSPLAGFPPLFAVLVNPGRHVSTPDVFRHLARKDNAAMPDIPFLHSAADVADFLTLTRNDLEAPATALAPEIGEARRSLERAGARFARMSGSGATVFGLFADRETARDAARAIERERPNWWTVATTLGSQGTTA